MNWETIEHICISIAVVGAAITYIYKGFIFAKRPADDMKDNVQGNKNKIVEHEDKFKEVNETLEYLKNANNLIIRSLFTVLGELSANNDVNGHIKEAQNEIQKFLTPVK